MKRPAATVIEVDAVAMMTPAPRGVVARASILSSRRSSLVLSAIDVNVRAFPAQASPRWCAVEDKAAGRNSADRGPRSPPEPRSPDAHHIRLGECLRRQ